MTTETATETPEEEIPAEVLAARPGEVVAVRDEMSPHQVIVWRAGQDPDIIGVVFDESAAQLDRGGFAAWTSKAPARGNIAGFYATEAEAVAAIGELNPAADVEPAAPAAVPVPRWRTLKGVNAPFLLWIERRQWDGRESLHAARNRKQPTGEPVTIATAAFEYGGWRATTAAGEPLRLGGAATLMWIAADTPAA